MKKLGLDLGDKTLGLAISDELNFLARGLDTLRFEDRDFTKPLNELLELLKKEKVDTLVLGHPKNMDGSIGVQGQTSLDFRDMILEKIDIKIIMWDERLTSKMASNMMKSQNLKKKKRKQDIDKMAAAIILQGYLDSLRQEKKTEENTFKVTNEEGVEETFEVVLTFKSEETGRSYVIYKLPGEDEEEVFAAIYDEEAKDGGNLIQIETEEEFDMVEEVLNSFLDEEEAEE